MVRSTWRAAMAVALMLGGVASGQGPGAREELALHARSDALVEAAAVGPLAPEGGDAALAEFERRYATEHLPLVAATPGLRGTRVQRVSQALGSETDLVLITAMDFDDRAALDAGLASDAGQQALHLAMRLNPLSYAVAGVRQLLAPGADLAGSWQPDLWWCWGVTVGFALVTFALATLVSRQPARGDLR